MTEHDDARSRWRCRRGMKELDILLERFLKSRFAAMDNQEKVVFSDFLNLSDPQLADFLLNGVVPAVPDEVVELVAERVQAINCTGGLWTRFRRGQRVHVLSGKMEGLAEVVEEPRSPEDRVRVLLEFMGRQVPAQVPWLNLRPIERTALALRLRT
ncbi:MAG: succinate dehydrogenase assembly factor 2, partial [Proteobacteria bacterium]|nr:succinate dehydrogenase assembly factor 2 [Pseudomonadota bacterium]